MRTIDAPVGKRQASPPTRRVVCILESLATRPATVTDLARDLGQSAATTHAILAELLECGWIVRDPTARTFTLGPVFDALARRVSDAKLDARPLLSELAEEFGVSVTLNVRAGNELVVIASAAPSGLTPPELGRRIPYAVPFGSAFAAYEDAEARRVWLQRVGELPGEVAQRWQARLDTVHGRGFAVERLGPAALRIAEVLHELRGELPDAAMQRLLQAWLTEVVDAPESGRSAREQVSAVAAPVFGPSGAVTHTVSAHPFRTMTTANATSIGRRTVEIAQCLAGS